VKPARPASRAGFGADIERLWNISDGTWFTQRIQELAALGGTN
jgi:hypothetical protein